MAAVFTDDKGQEWTLRLDYTLVRDIRKALGIDLIDIKGQSEALVKMASNPGLLVDTVHFIAKEQAEQRGISDEDFGRGFAEGDTFTKAAEALRQAIENFTVPQDRELFQKATATQMGAREKAVQKAIDILTGPTATAVIDKTLQKSAAEMERKLMSGA